MFKSWFMVVWSVWNICLEISICDIVTQRENGSTSSIAPTTLPPLLTLSSFFEEVTAAMPQHDLFLFNARLEDVEDYIKTQNRVHEYLAGFKNEFQRFVVENQMKYCPYVKLCDFEINAKTDQKSCCDSCMCESTCDSEKGCCPSHLNETKFVHDINDTVLLNGINMMLNTEITKSGGLTKQTCNLRHLTIRPSYLQKGFLAVSDCPFQSDLELVYNCTRPYTDDLRIKDTLPAYSNISLSLFRNKFCALCNGVLEEDIMYFRPVVSCGDREHLSTHVSSEQELVELIFSNESCDLTYAFYDERVHIKECKYFISKCNVTADWKQYDIRLDLACQLYESKFTHENYVFRNVFCALCNGIIPHSVTCDIHYILATDVFAFSGLLNLDFDQGFTTTYLAQNRENQRSSCSTEQLYDALTNRCKDIYCPGMRVLRDGRCINAYTDVFDAFSYILYVRLKPQSTQSAGDVFANDSDWSFNVMNIFQANFSNLDICETQLLFKFDIDFDKITLPALIQSRLQYVDVRLRLFEESREPWRVADDLLKLHNTNLRIVNNEKTSIEYTLFVMDSDVRIFNIAEMLLGSNGLHSEVKSSPTPEKRIGIMSKYALTDTDGLTLLPYTFFLSLNHGCYMKSYKIDVIRFSSCPKVNISKVDIPWTNDVDGLDFNALKIPSNTYYYIDHLHIMICTEMFQKIMHHLTPERTLNAEIIVSISCSSLSILSLFVTFVVYCIIPKLRTPLPGKNNVSLTVHLLIAQTLLLVGSLGPFEQYSTGCKVVGVLIHFIWLCTIFWMNVCTYHMFRVLAKTHASVTDYGSKTFILYLFYVYIMSATFVLANLISSIVTSGNIGYGGKFCYITSREKLMFTFVLPTLVTIVINISMFLSVILKIRRAPHIRKHVNHERNELVIFAKLSTITGLTWIFGFLYIWTGVLTFSFIFIILNAGQGIFILFAFVINRKVFTLMKERIKLSKQSDHQKTSDLSKRTNSSKL